MKRLGTWIALGQHTSYWVFEAPSLEAFKQFQREPEFWNLGALEIMQIKSVINMEKAMELLKH
jgi:hypothetical protein